MSKQPGAPQPADSHRGLRLFGLAAVAAGLLLLMAAAFVLSYTGIHAVALSAGVSGRFARIYPVIFDAMLVIACAAVLSLRGAGLPSRCYAWLTMLVLLAAAAGADTVHATSTSLPHKAAAAAAAIIPWALVLIGFGLLLAMLRQARLRRAALTADRGRTSGQPSGHVQVRHGLDELLGRGSSAGGPAVRQPPGNVGPAADPALDLAIDAEPGLDDPASDEGHPAVSHAREREAQQPAGYRGNSGPAFSSAPTVDLAGDTKPATEETAAEAEPGPETVPEAEPGPETAAEAEPTPEVMTEAVPETAAEAELAPETRPGSAPGIAVETGSDSTPAVPLQFDRMRSSPVPPDS
jgi:hypothetical protein